MTCENRSSTLYWLQSKDIGGRGSQKISQSKLYLLTQLVDINHGLHAISSGQISMHKLLFGEVFHSESDMMTKTNQMKNRQNLQKSRSLNQWFSTRVPPEVFHFINERKCVFLYKKIEFLHRDSSSHWNVFWGSAPARTLKTIALDLSPLTNNL